MNIMRNAFAGTLESSDVFVKVSPGGQGITVDIQSVVLGQFGAAIEETVREVLGQLAVTDAAVEINDRGALECTIRARVETAVRRAGGEN